MGALGMTQREVFGGAALAAMAAVLVWAPTASANTTACSGVLGPVLVDNVVVPGRASCQMEGTQVSGDVAIQPGGTLGAGINTGIAGDVVVNRNATFSISKATIGGDVTCSRCRWIGIFETDVGGSVHIQGAAQAVFVEISSIVGDLEIIDGAAGAGITITRGGVFGDLFLSRNRGPLRMVRQEVGGDLRIVENVSSVGFELSENSISRGLLFSRNTGPSAINANTIGETLACFENDPEPTGSGNVAAELAGQCAGLG
jgi:hypothetical protein